MKRIVGICILLSFFLLTGCIKIVPAQTASTTPTAVLANILPTVTQVPVVIYITATPQPGTAVPTLTTTPIPTATAIPTATPVPSLTLNTLTDLGGGTINVTWTASGDFSKGFQIVWSATNSQPVFPTDTTTYVSDGNARATQIHGTPGSSYYVRVCRYVSDTCDLYSNVQQVTLSGTPVYQPAPYYPPSYPAYYPQYYPSYYPTVNATVAPYLYISMIKYAGSGSADIYWRTYGDFNNGYRLLFSTDPATLTYGDSLQYVITNGYQHMLTVNGVNSITYYFRICRFTGTTCDLYSNQASYTFTQ